MTSPLAMLVLAVVVVGAIIAGGVLVGATRAGELVYLRQRVAVLEAELATRPREADVAHLREGYERTIVARDLDLTHLRAAHGTAVAQVIALADASAHARLNPRQPAPSSGETEISGRARSFDPGVHREAEDISIEDRMLEAPTYRAQTEEEIRAEFEEANPPEGG